MPVKANPTGRKKTKMDDDPLDVNFRLYKQISRLLEDIEKRDLEEDGITVPQRISALIAVGRLQKIFVDLRKEDFSGVAGSAIDKYSAAFTSPNATRRGEPNARRAANVVEFDSSADAEPGDPDYAA